MAATQSHSASHCCKDDANKYLFDLPFKSCNTVTWSINTYGFISSIPSLCLFFVNRMHRLPSTTFYISRYNITTMLILIHESFTLYITNVYVQNQAPHPKYIFSYFRYSSSTIYSSLWVHYICFFNWLLHTNVIEFCLSGILYYDSKMSATCNVGGCPSWSMDMD